MYKSIYLVLVENKKLDINIKHKLNIKKQAGSGNCVVQDDIKTLCNCLLVKVQSLITDL